MSRQLAAGLAAATLVVVLVGAATAATAADPGITAQEIVIGGTVPLSGEAAAFGSVGPGAKAYFDHVNARGGVNGRRIRYLFYDDAYNPAQTVQLTRRLVEQDRVFALFNVIGTANNLAIRDYANAQQVPQLFSGDGSEALAAPRSYPWTMGFLQSYRGEGAVYGRDVVKRRPKAKLAVLLENTELGKDMARGLSRAIAGKGPRVVASEAYEYTASDVSAQIAKLKASGADTLMLFATPKFMIQAVVAANKLGWKPQLYIASVSIEPAIMGIARLNAPTLTKGALSIAFVKNPNDPVWAKDPALKLYRSVMKRYQPERQAGRRLQLVRHDRGVVDGRHAATGRQDADPGEPARGRAVDRHAEQPVHAAGDPSPDLAAGLLPDRHRLPVPLRQPPVGALERAARRRDDRSTGYGTMPGTNLRLAVPDMRDNTRRAQTMRKRISIALVAVVAAIAVPAVVIAATSAYTSPTLKVRYAGAATVISATAAAADDATARAAIYVPTGTTVTATQAPGTQLGTVNAQVSALALGGALLPLTGPIIVAPPGAVPAASQTACIQTADAELDVVAAAGGGGPDDQPARLPDPDRRCRDRARCRQARVLPRAAGHPGRHRAERPSARSSSAPS